MQRMQTELYMLLEPVPIDIQVLIYRKWTFIVTLRNQSTFAEQFERASPKLPRLSVNSKLLGLNLHSEPQFKYSLLMPRIMLFSTEEHSLKKYATVYFGW